MRFNKLVVAVLAAGLVPAAIPVSSAQAQDASRMIMELQELREEVRELRGLVEDQQREIERLGQRQRDQYLDLDRRLQQAESAPPAAVSPGTAAPGTAAPGTMPPVAADPRDTLQDRPPPERSDRPEVRPPLETRPEVTPLPPPAADGPRDLGTPTEAEQVAYDRAFRALRELRYADAAEGFDAFLRDYPDSAYAPNAQYWLGESYYVTRDFATALDAFQSLLQRYPGSSKEGDALLKIGFSHYELRQWNEARAALEQVRSNYAGTTLARLAENRLRNMRLEGHF